MTKFVKKNELNNNWYEIDASNAVVGRLATIIAKILRGKNKATFTPHMDNGDFVVVKNIEKIKFTGKKFKDKKYYRHTGYPGGIKETTPEKLFDKKPGEAGHPIQWDGSLWFVHTSTSSNTIHSNIGSISDLDINIFSQSKKNYLYLLILLSK